jgi:hypothetical protein
MDQEDNAIADAASLHFPQIARKLRGVQAQLNLLPGSPEGPAVFARLGDALEQCIRTCRQTKPTVKLVLKHLDVLRDGVQLLQLYEADLTPDAVRAVNTAHEVLTIQAAQLEEIGIEATNVRAAATRIAAHLRTDRPWREIATLDDDLDEIRHCYTGERQRLLQWQEEQVEAARSRVKAREGFSTLTADQSHHVLRPLASTVTDTSAEAIAPALAALRDPFAAALRRAEDQANDLLDGLLSEGSKPLITRLDLRLHNREITTEADIDALVSEIRSRLLEQVRPAVGHGTTA